MPEKNLTPEQHNDRRRQKKRKQSATAKAAAAHKKKESKVDTRVIVDGEFDLDDLCWKAKELNYNYITYHFLLRLMRENKLAIHIGKCAIPEIENKTIYPTYKGWCWEDGSLIETSITIDRVVVPLATPIAVIFTWRLHRQRKCYWMEVQ